VVVCSVVLVVCCVVLFLSSGLILVVCLCVTCFDDIFLQGRGRIEGNDISHNRRAGVAIIKEGEPLVHDNRIHDGKDSGVLVCENGGGEVNVDIYTIYIYVSGLGGLGLTFVSQVCDNEIFFSHMARLSIYQSIFRCSG